MKQFWLLGASEADTKRSFPDSIRRCRDTCHRSGAPSMIANTASPSGV
jgi:hypothetical protein